MTIGGGQGQANPSKPATEGGTPAASAAPAVPGVPVAAAGERRFQQRRPDGPRRVRHGLKPSRKDSLPQSPLAVRWMKLAEPRFDPATLATGLEYMRSGQIVSLEVRAGAVEASVQGSAIRPYAVRIALPVFSEDLWEKIVEAMAAEAMYVAKLITNELPGGTDSLLAGLDCSLLPDDPDQIALSCACGSDAPCKHIAAALYLTADRLDLSPTLIFAFRGMSADRLLDRVRRARAIQAHGEAAAHSDAAIAETQAPAPALESCLDDFWRAGQHLNELDAIPPAAHAPHALLRRLGPSPLPSRFPMVGLLASIYDTVAGAARKLLDEPGIDPPDALDAEEPSSADAPEER